MKRCTKCRRDKPRSDFYRHAGRSDGLCSRCKSCMDEDRADYTARNRGRVRESQRIRSRRWYENNKQKTVERARARDASNPVQRSERVRRRRARIRGATAERVDYAAILIRDAGRCHICGDPVRPDDLDFDHVIPIARGGAHHDGNIAVSHATCNRAKGARCLQRKEAA